MRGEVMKKQIDYLARKSVYDKVRKYIFNSENEEGCPKGKWFMLALGFNPENTEHVKMLTRQIHFDNLRAKYTGTTEYGEKYSLFLSITGPNGKTIDGIRTRWQKDKDSDVIRLITILPPKKR